MPAPLTTPVVPPPAAAPKPPAAPVAKQPAAPVAKPAPVDPNAPPAPEGGAPAEQKYKVKVDGQVLEMTQAEVEKWASKGRFSDKAIQEAREAIKKARAVEEKYKAEDQARREKAKADTDAWLLEHGIDPDEYAKKKLEKKVAEGKMTEEQRDAQRRKDENEALKKRIEQIEQETKEKQAQALATRLQQHVENQLASAAKRANMSMGDEGFFAIYESFRDMYELGFLPENAADLTPAHADRVIEDAMAKLDGAQKHLRENAMKLSGKALLDFVGKEAADRIVAARLEEIRAARGQGTAQPANTKQPAPAANGSRTPYLTQAEADAQVKKLIRGG